MKAFAIIFASTILVLTGCAEEEAPRGLAAAGPVIHDTDDQDDDVVTGPCVDGEVRVCKVQIDDNNCFVGEQLCEDGVWGDCLEAASENDN